MSGNDRRTALLGCIEKIRELIASFFRALTQDEVYHVLSPRQPYSTVQTQSIASGRQLPLGPSLGSPHQCDLTEARRAGVTPAKPHQERQGTFGDNVTLANTGRDKIAIRQVLARR